MRVFLGNPPWRKPGYYGVRAGSRWPHYEVEHSRYMPFPFFLAYAAAVLEKHGHAIRIIDACAERSDLEAFVARLVEFSPDLVLLEVSSASFNADLEAARRIKVAHPVPLVLCGVHPEIYQPAFLEQNELVDIVLVGEYDLTLLDVVNALEGDGNLATVPGIIYRDGADHVRRTAARPLVQELNVYPWPHRATLPMLKYYDQPGDIPEPTLQVWASRGCPYRCSFCVWPQVVYTPGSYRVRDPKAVMDEVEDCVNKWHFRSVYFDDDTFNVGKPRMMALAEEWRRRQLGIPWAAMCRADTSDEETFRALHQAGLVAVKLGIESADQQIVKDCGKNLDLERVTQSVCLLRSLGVKIHLTFSFGLPGETPASMEQTIQYAKQLNLDSVQFSITTPFPGTKIHEELAARGHLAEAVKWDNLDGYNRSCVRTAALEPAQIEAGLRRAYREWYKHKAWRALVDRQHIQYALRHPVDGVRKFLYAYRTWRGMVRTET